MPLPIPIEGVFAEVPRPVVASLMGAAPLLQEAVTSLLVPRPLPASCKLFQPLFMGF